MREERRLRLRVDDRANIDADVARIADFEFARGAGDHRDHPVGDILLQAKQPQRRTALPRRAKRRGDDVVAHLFRQGGRIDDHRVNAAGFRDQRCDRAILRGERAVDRSRCRRRAGEGDARDAGQSNERRTGFAVAGNEAQHIFGNAAAMQQRDGLRRDQRRLFGRFRQHTIAGDESRCDLAE